MEDLGFLKWMAVIALIVYNGIRQIRKNARKGERNRRTAHGEAWPTGTPAPRQTGKRPQQSPERVAAAPQETGPQHTKMPMQPEYTPRAAKKACKASLNTQTSTGPALPENTEIEPQNIRNEDFDLRQAVVMSEILKPKFDD